ncbi:MAG: hypothetical protein AMJ66_03240 [Betaproteobacteria bacterium SG8_40]|jgi:hypothetical protein|nr:MAG: hypothetical protein AMJ66_03240 [Betaproteobacteria bacterium SG8_40]
MNNEIDNAILKLDQHRNLTLREAKGDCIHVHWGHLWVTRNGDLRDHVVSSGESLAIDRPGTIVLTALSEAGVSLMKRCAGNAATASVVLQQCGSAVSGGATREQGGVPASPVARATTAMHDYPEYSEIDRHVNLAHQLRARYVIDALGNAWNALRGVFSA